MGANGVIVLTGGSGSRFGGALPKQFLELEGKTLLEYSIDAFESHPDIKQILIVAHPDHLARTKAVVKKRGFQKTGSYVAGGDTRQQSSRNGIRALEGSVENVLIHDGARPFVSRKLIDSLLEALTRWDAVIPVIPSTDTIVALDAEACVAAVPERDHLKRVQTPQAFKMDLISRAHSESELAGHSVSDDASMVQMCGLAAVKTVPGEIRNIKITYPSDLETASHILSEAY